MRVLQLPVTIGFEAKVDLEEGIRRTAELFRAQAADP
jgi:hypothetical protein